MQPLPSTDDAARAPIDAAISRCTDGRDDLGRLRAGVAELKLLSHPRAAFAAALFELDLARRGEPEARAAMLEVADSLLSCWKDQTGPALAATHPALGPLWQQAAGLLERFQLKRFARQLDACWEARADAHRLAEAVAELGQDDDRRAEFARCLYHLELARQFVQGSRVEFARRAALLHEAYLDPEVARELVGDDAGLEHLWAELIPYLDEFFESLEGARARTAAGPGPAEPEAAAEQEDEVLTPEELPDAPLALPPPVAPPPPPPSLPDPARAALPSAPNPPLELVDASAPEAWPELSFAPSTSVPPALTPRFNTAPTAPLDLVRAAVPAPRPSLPRPEAVITAPVELPAKPDDDGLEVITGDTLPPGTDPASVGFDLSQARTLPPNTSPLSLGFDPSLSRTLPLDLPRGPPPPPPSDSLPPNISREALGLRPRPRDVETLDPDAVQELPPKPPDDSVPFLLMEEDDEPGPATMAFWRVTEAALGLLPPIDAPRLNSRVFAADSARERKKLSAYLGDVGPRFQEIPEARAMQCLLQLYLAGHLKEKTLFGQKNEKRVEGFRAALSLLSRDPVAAGHCAVWFEMDGPRTVEKLADALEVVWDYLQYCARNQLDPLAPTSTRLFLG